MRTRHRKQTYPIWPMTQRDEVFWLRRGGGRIILTRHAAESHEDEATTRERNLIIFI